MQNLVGIALLAFAGWVYSKGSFDIREYAQMGIGSLGGLYVLISENLERLKSLIKSLSTKKLPSLPDLRDQVKEEVNTVEEVAPNVLRYPITTRDYISLCHIRDACLNGGSAEGATLAAQISDILFRMEIKDKNGN
jgi:hypothetical protein